jgi:glucan-binding YG repeat protein
VPSLSGQSASPPAEPEYRRAQRARVILDFTEGDEHIHVAETGWARPDGPWLHFHSDENEQDGWQSWPMTNVVCVDWDAVEDPAF